MRGVALRCTSAVLLFSLFSACLQSIPSIKRTSPFFLFSFLSHFCLSRFRQIQHFPTSFFQSFLIYLSKICRNFSPQFRWLRRAAQPSGSWWRRLRAGSLSWRGEVYAPRPQSCWSASQGSPPSMPAPQGESVASRKHQHRPFLLDLSSVWACHRSIDVL